MKDGKNPNKNIEYCIGRCIYNNLIVLYANHDYYTNKQISEDEMAQENKDDSKPLAVRPFVKIFLNLSPAIHL